MKNLHFIYTLFFSLFILSCSSDDNNNNDDDNTPAGVPTFQATLNGGSFSNYVFKLGIYNAKKGSNGNTLSINLSDINGKLIDLFLNETGGFSSGTIKQIENVDSAKFKTHAGVRDNDPALSYISTSGTIKITTNRAHPSNSKQRLISGEFNITASTIPDKNKEIQKVEMKGYFSELVYTE